MAVSQYLRQGSLLDAVRSHLTPDVIHKASSLVGESESSTRQTLHAAAPSLLSGLTNMASSQEGASGLTSMIRDGGFGSVVNNVGSIFGGGGPTISMLNTGQTLLGKIFGNRSSSVTEAVARHGGVSTASAAKLLALASPLVLGVLGKRASEHKLDSSGLANTLLSEKSEIAAASPSGLSQILSSGPSVVSSTVRESTVRDRDTEWKSTARPEYYAERTVVPQRSTGGMRWLLLGLALLAGLGLLLFLRGRMPTNVGETANQGINAARNALERVSLPGGSILNLVPGSINYNLAHFLGDSSASAPRTFVFDNLNFETAGTQLTPDSLPTVNNMASILKAYPNTQVELVGYTDNTGAPEANQALSLNRANAVKTMLVDQGVGAGRIATRGLGQENPVAPNDSEDGRARNRRTELTVTNK